MDSTDILFTNGHECFGMSGPWLGNCTVNNRLLKKEFLLDNFVYSPDKKFLALSRYSNLPGWAADREFKIVVLDLVNETYFISKRGSGALFLDSMQTTNITFFIAFHDEIPELKRSIRFSSDHFNKIPATELFE